MERILPTTSTTCAGGRGSFALGRQGKALFEKMAFVPRTEGGERVS